MIGKLGWLFWCNILLYGSVCLHKKCTPKIIIKCLLLSPYLNNQNIYHSLWCISLNEVIFDHYHNLLQFWFDLNIFFHAQGCVRLHAFLKRIWNLSAWANLHFWNKTVLFFLTYSKFRALGWETKFRYMSCLLRMLFEQQKKTQFLILNKGKQNERSKSI